MTEKIDFFEWKRNSGYSDDEADVLESYTRKLSVLEFSYDDRNNISSFFNGHRVYPDWNHTSEIANGDIWLCSLTESPNSNTYFAIPLKRITLAEVLNFNEDLRVKVLDALWARNRDDLSKIFEDRFKDEVRKEVSEEVSREYEGKMQILSSANEDLRRQLTESNFMLDKARTTVSEAPDEYVVLGSDDDVQVSAGDDAIILSSDDAPRPAVADAPVQTVQRTVPVIKRVTESPQKFEVWRKGRDSLYSESFTDTRYFVHISPDYSRLVIRPDENGTVRCYGNRIELEGLGFLSGFTTEKNLRAEYSQMYGGMLVWL